MRSTSSSPTDDEPLAAAGRSPADARAAQLGVDPAVALERADRRFQAVYTLCLAVISGLGYTALYRLMYRRSLPGWRGAFTLSLGYLAFLFTIFLPWLMVIPPLRARFGDGATYAVLGIGVFVCALWNTAAARRIGAHRWPAAIAKGIAVVVFGMLLDTFMSVTAIAVSLRLA